MFWTEAMDSSMGRVTTVSISKGPTPVYCVITIITGKSIEGKRSIFRRPREKSPNPTNTSNIIKNVILRLMASLVICIIPPSRRRSKPVTLRAGYSVLKQPVFLLCARLNEQRQTDGSHNRAQAGVARQEKNRSLHTQN